MKVCFLKILLCLLLLCMLVSCAPTGIYHTVKPGQTLYRIAMTYDVVPRTGATPYTIVGNWPVVALCVLVLLWTGWRTRA